MEPGLPAPQALAEEILAQALGLTEKLASLLEEKPSQTETLQDALISFTQVLLLGFMSAFAKLYPERDFSEYENEVFLALAKLTLSELLQKEASETEYEYFLTFYRSHFEILRRDISQSQDFWPEAEEEIFLEIKRRLEELFRRLLQEGEIRH